jgi:hypothetical protein
MPEGSVQQRTLRKLVQVLGAADAVARKLQVTAADLRGWVEGVAEVPTHVFLRAVDLLLEQPLENYVRPVGGRLIKPEAGGGKKCNNGE